MSMRSFGLFAVSLFTIWPLISKELQKDGTNFHPGGAQGHNSEDEDNRGRDGEEENVDETGNGTLLNVEAEQSRLNLMEHLFRTWPLRRND